MKMVGNVQLVAGDKNTLPAVLKFLAKEGVKTTANPDLLVRTYMHFGVDEARDIKERASRRAIASARRVFVILFSVATNEAQNALLKTFEEPLADALFILVVPSPETLLATVRSRAQILKIDSVAVDGSLDAKKFIAGSGAVRLEMLKPLLDKDENERRDLGAIITFLSSLERTLASVQDMQKKQAGLKAVYLARKYIADKGALVKPLLEQVALLV